MHIQTHRAEFERLDRPPAAPSEPAQLYPAVAEIESEVPILPRDHPPWMRDAVALSAHARTLLQGLRPPVIRVLGFWDHAVRSIQIAGRRVNVDPAGCYRID